MSEHTTAARHAFKALLSGAPNGATPEGLGPWWAAYQPLKSTFDELGVEAMREAFGTIAATREGRSLARLLAGDPQPPAPKLSACPPLPAEAAAIVEDAEPCGRWLDQYIEFASKAAPMTPRSFHEAAGLFLMSTVIARRLVLQVSTTSIYPNLFALFIAPSTLYSKTTGFKLITDMNASGVIRWGNSI